jgi:hypothetical protein
VKFSPVSHLKERKEKICLNCGADLYGRFCHICGQQNLEPKETVWHLVQHFFNDITHFDGSFFSTAKYLLRKPGFLSLEYMAGRRASYLNPIRMYVFTSAFFFIILFTIKKPEQVIKTNSDRETTKGLPDLLKTKTGYEQDLAKTTDPDDRADLQQDANRLGMQVAMIKKLYGDTTTRKFTQKDREDLVVQTLTDSLKLPGLDSAAKRRLSEALRVAEDPMSGSNFFGMNQGRFRSLAAYDSTQGALPESLRDGWFKHKLMRQLVLSQEEFMRDKQRYKERLVENLYHSFPKILFWSLPFFALILNALYFRHRQYLYVDHGIFAIHVYCATFVLLLFALLLGQLSNLVHWEWFKTAMGLLIFGLYLFMFFYLYKAMRSFYKQRRFKTIVKYLITCLLAFVLNLVVFMIFLLISVITV